MHDLKKAQSWRKGEAVLTQGCEINNRTRGHERLGITNDQRFYNLKICNITEYDFGIYLCETQQGNSVTTEGTKLIHSGMSVGKSLFNGLFATGFVLLCLSICGNCFFDKFRAALERRKERILDHENQNVQQRNAANNGSTNVTTLVENENVFSHYETINENEMIELPFPTTSQNAPNLSCATYKVQSLQPDNTSFEIIEYTSNKKTHT
ncbi:unnamed protein product [Mytilus edulis]|uniref:Uncharacterized protein n=1 Tax=Mytilus edulis TaxID=6550 RepID=A0A8S3T943_MYTED|nr:unnamed protein product [Mytilus edulis]